MGGSVTAAPDAVKAAPHLRPPSPSRPNPRGRETDSDETLVRRVVDGIDGASPRTPPSHFSTALDGVGGSAAARVGVLDHLQRTRGNSFVGAVIEDGCGCGGACCDERKRDGDDTLASRLGLADQPFSGGGGSSGGGGASGGFGQAPAPPAVAPPAPAPGSPPVPAPGGPPAPAPTGAPPTPTGGVVIRIPDITLFEPTTIPIVSAPMQSIFIPLIGAGVDLGPIILAGLVGVRVGAQPALVATVGPGYLRNISVIIDPLASRYGATAQFYAGAALSEILVLEGAIRAEGYLILLDPPFYISVALEGGLRGTFRGSVLGAIQVTATLMYNSGAITLDLVNTVMLGALLEVDLDAFINAQLYDFIICEWVWPLFHWQTGQAHQWTLPISFGYGTGGPPVSIGPVLSGPIPVEDIEVGIDRQRPQTRCLGLEEIIAELCRLKILPPELCPTDEEPGAGAAGNCVANDNLGETADSFISRCRKASIRREFPGELLQETLGAIKRGKSAKHKKAWKLLNDNRFKKPDTSAAADCPIPVNFRQTVGRPAAGGVLHFEYAWDSSTGDLKDLKDCVVGEHVSYPGPNPFVWPKPPWNGSTPNPTVIFPSPGSDGGIQDNHSSKPFIKPYQEANFTAVQHYQYKCPCKNGGNPVNIMGPISIVRSVTQKPDGSFKYTITKSGVTATIDPLPP